MNRGISPTLLMNETILAKTKNGVEVCALGFGRSPFPIPNILSESLADNATKSMYLPSAGHALLRKEIANHHNFYSTTRSEAKHVVISPGSKEIIFQIQWACKLPLILPAPSWVSYGPQAKFLNLDLHWIDTEKSNGYKLTSASLIKYVTNHKLDKALLILNYPNNPTGVSYTDTELKAIAEVCRKRNILVISDEIYGLLNFKGSYNSISNFLPDQTIVTSGLSKWCNAGGYRLGYGIFPPKLSAIKNKVISQASETYSCVAAPIQYAAIAVYKNWQIINEQLIRQRKVLQFVSSYMIVNLRKIGIDCSETDGGFYTFVNFEMHRKYIEGLGIKTSEDFCHYLLNEWSIALLPGSSFGRKPTEFSARLAFVDFDGEKALSVVENYSSSSDFVNEVCPKIKKSISQLTHFLNF